MDEMREEEVEELEDDASLELEEGREGSPRPSANQRLDADSDDDSDMVRTEEDVLCPSLLGVPLVYSAVRR